MTAPKEVELCRILNLLINKAFNSSLKTEIKKANLAVETGAENKAEAVRVAVKKIDQAAAKGILHKNAAARKKSALVRKLNGAQA